MIGDLCIYAARNFDLRAIKRDFLMQSKPRVVKDYDRLEDGIQEQIKLTYPRGFSKHLVRFTNREGKLVSALPFETDEKYYLVRMTIEEAKDIIRQDDDYDEDGVLKDDVMEEYQEKHTDLDEIPSEEMDEEDDDMD